MEIFLYAETWISLLTLTFLEIVLGIDNIIFISISANKLPKKHVKKATLVGLSLAMITRILLLFSVSYLIALKLAQFEFIKKQSGLTPILLLDDIFDKLDENRVSQIVSLVNNDEFGQIFITDTHSERTETIVKETGTEYQIFKL